jgi:predicted acylesterase/phospholipase RssA
MSEQILPRKNCDIVMKGGITSGIVYPRAVSELSKQYCFKNIGGASAGAIAAAATAAAEYRRRKDGLDDGFVYLDQLPKKLGTPVDRVTRLFTLFKPQPETKSLFDALTAGARGNSWMVLPRVIWAYRWFAALGFLVFGSLASLGAERSPAGWVLVSAMGIVGSIVLVGLRVYWDGTRALVRNRFGLCRGHSNVRTEPGREELTEWLSHLIDEVATGNKKPRAPLSFGDLWNVAHSPADAVMPKKGGPRSIDLKMVTTNLTHGQPYELPFDPEKQRIQFYFKESDLLEFFPQYVVEHMVTNAGAPPNERRANTAGFIPLPPPAKLPLVFAARLSLSFPILISAVPLYAIDFTRHGDGLTPERCWFSDGGISSNFPVHMFDSPIPEWPTFAINLRPFPRNFPTENVYMPTTNDAGSGAMWQPFDVDNQGRSLPCLKQLVGFVISIIETAKSWHDNLQYRVPGFRDRVAHVSLHDNEGGINLNMGKGLINKVAARGQQAATELVDRFVRRKLPQMSWDNHRWVRLRSTLAALTAVVTDFVSAYQMQPSDDELSYKTILEDPKKASNDYAWRDPQQRADAEKTVALLADISKALKDPASLRENAPEPMPILRKVPDL